MPAGEGTDCYLNPRAARPDAGALSDLEALTRAESDEAIEEISRWPDYAETPLVALPGHARRLRIGALLYKDEAGRFGLGSFKSLGGAYAIYRLLKQRVRDARPEIEPSAADLEGGAHQAITSNVSVCCATDGNHGRSVAWGAQKFRCGAIIYLHEHVSAGRERAIARYGAEIVRTPGGYDESVTRAAADAAEHGWTVVSDTSWPGYRDIPRDVMHGYTVMAEEVIRRTRQAPPTHVFVQAGVGGVAAAVCVRFLWAFGDARPRLVVVEPRRAACLLESAREGRSATVPIREETVMACLSAGAPSQLAWQVLDCGADAFMALAESSAPAAMRALAEPPEGDVPVVAGESGAAGFAALTAACASEEIRAALELNEHARVLVFGTEGATDADIYQRLVGRAPEEVAAA